MATSTNSGTPATQASSSASAAFLLASSRTGTPSSDLSLLGDAFSSLLTQTTLQDSSAASSSSSYANASSSSSVSSRQDNDYAQSSANGRDDRAASSTQSGKKQAQPSSQAEKKDDSQDSANAQQASSDDDSSSQAQATSSDEPTQKADAPANDRSDDEAPTNADDEKAQTLQDVDSQVAATLIMANAAQAKPQAPTLQTDAAQTDASQASQAEAQASETVGTDEAGASTAALALLSSGAAKTSNDQASRAKTFGQALAENATQAQTSAANTLAAAQNAAGTGSKKTAGQGDGEVALSGAQTQTSTEDDSGSFSLFGLSNAATTQKTTGQEAQQSNAATRQNDFLDLFNIQTASSGVAANAGLIASNQGTNVSGKSGSSSALTGVENFGTQTGASAAGTSSGTQLSVEGGKLTGSYDFASQLAAAKETKSGSSTTTSVVQQVALHLTKQAKDGVEEMTVKLNPADLGRVDVKLSFASDKSVQGTIVADSQATLDLLAKDVGSLQRALQDAGLRADSNSLQFSLRSDGQSNAFNAYSQNSGNGNSSGNHRAFARSDMSVADDSDASGASEIYYLTPGRINIHV